MDQGFLAPRRQSPTTLGIVILAHVAALAAVMLAKGPAVFKRFEPTQTISILQQPDPPPLPPEPVPDTPQPRADTRVTVPKPIVIADRTTSVDIVPLPLMPPLPPVQGPIALPEPPPPHVVATTDPDIDRRFARNFQPAYPPALMRAEIEGRAMVRVLIGADGRVKAVEIVSADDPGFAEATRKQALGFWRFKPATRDGVAVETWKTMTVRFRLEA